MVTITAKKIFFQSNPNLRALKLTLIDMITHEYTCKVVYLSVRLFGAAYKFSTYFKLVVIHRYSCG